MYALSRLVPDVRSRIHMQRNAPFFQVSCFSKEGWGCFRSAPFRRCYTRVVRSTYVFWIRPPEGEPSSDLDPSPTGRGGDSSISKQWKETWHVHVASVGLCLLGRVPSGCDARESSSFRHLCMSLAGLRYYRVGITITIDYRTRKVHLLGTTTEPKCHGPSINTER